MATRSLGTLTIDLIAKTGGFEQGMDRASRNAKSRADQIEASFNKVRLAALTVGASMATASAAWVASMSSTFDAAAKMAGQIGTTTEALTGLRYAAAQMANVNDSTLDMSLRRMTRRVAEAAAGSGAASNALRELGLNASELARLPVDEQFLRIADAMQSAERQSDRLRHTMAIFDSEGMPLVNALSQGRAEIERFIREAERFGVVISTEAARAAEDLQSNLARLKAQFDGLSINLANNVLPTISRFIENAMTAASETDDLHAAARRLAGDTGLPDWAYSVGIGFARVIDVTVALAKSVNVAIGAVTAAVADSRAVIEYLRNMPTNPMSWFDSESEQRFQDALDNRKRSVEKFNKDLNDLWTYQGNRFEQAWINATSPQTRIGSGGPVALVDLTKPPAEPIVATTKALKGLRDEMAQFEAERQSFLEGQYNEIAAIEQKAMLMEQENSVYGQARSAIESLHIARLEEKAAMLAGFSGSEKQIEIINREIAARKRLLEATEQREELDKGRRAAEEANREYERFAEEAQRQNEMIGQSLTDALLRGFEDGKSFAQNFRDTLRNLFNTLVLRPIIQPIAEQAASTITGFMGVGGQSRGGVGGFGGLGGMASMSGVGAAPGTLGMANAWGSMGGDSMGALIAGNSGRWGVTSNMASTVSTGLGYAAALYALTEKQYGTAVGTAIGTAIMPGIGTMIGSTLGSLVDGMFSQPEARYGGTYQHIPGIGTERPGWERGDPGPQAMAFADNLLATTSDAIQRAFEGVGSGALLTALEASFESSEKGRGGTHSGGWLLVDGELIRFGTERKGQGFGGRDGTVEEMMRNAEIDTWQTVIQAWQAGIDQFPRMMQDMIRGVDADALGLEAAQQLAQQFIQVIEQINGLSEALRNLPFVPATAATFEYAAALAEATGGAESAATMLASYYQEYYSEAERNAHLTSQLTEEFSRLGFTLPQTRDELRGLIEAQMALGEAGIETLAVLLRLQSAFASLVSAGSSGVDELNAAFDAAFDAQLARVRDLAAEVNRLSGLRNSAGNLLDRINRNTMFAGQREAELWAAMSTASYEQQIELAAELTDIVLSRYDTEIQAAQRLQDMGRSLRDYLSSLATSELAPTDLATKVAEAERQLNEAVAKARLGDEDAMAQIQGLTQNALELWRRYGASGDAYQDAYYRITGSVGDLASQAMSEAERQLAVSQETVAQLEQLRGVAETAYNAIDAQYQASLQGLQLETESLTELGAQTGRLNEIADLLRGMPAELAAQLQPVLSGAINSAVSSLYVGTGISPDQEAMDYWGGQLATQPASVVSGDFYRTLVDNWYKDNLGWSGDIQGINYWADQVEQIGAQKAFEDFAREAGIPGYAMGGYASGLSLVGERGPELVDFRQPGRVYTNDALAGIMGRLSNPDAASGALVAEVKALREEVKTLREQNNQGHAANAQATERTGGRVAEAISESGWEHRLRR